MNRPFKLELFREGREAACYALKFADEEYSEPQKFIHKFERKEQESFEDIEYRLEYMLDEHLFLPPMLKLEEGRRDDWVVAIKTVDPKHLRWYGLRYNDRVMILGNGGLKTTRTYQEDSYLCQCVKDLQYVYRCIKEKMRRREISFNLSTNRITGDLNFN